MASVFDEGKLPFKFITEETPFSSCFDSSAPPKPLLIATLTVNGTYPVLLLLQGFYLRNYFYKGILQHIASHGFIAVGPQKNDCISQPCASDGVNHKEFFNESKPPCAHFVAKDYGHMDMLDDDPPGLVGALSGCLCKNGSGPKDLMRKSVGGIVVAFLKAYLNGEDGDLLAIVADPGLSPAKLDPVKFITA
ncbi:hypothetical protein ACLB2K_015826 [Fragaria x ananassa]